MDTNRIALLDSLRGFSLFRILIANLLIFQYGIWGEVFLLAFQRKQAIPDASAAISRTAN